MSNFKNFIGGKQFEYASGNSSIKTPTDGTNTISSDVINTYIDQYSTEVLNNFVLPANGYDSVTQGTAFKSRYVNGANIHIPWDSTVNGTQIDFIGLECVNLQLDGLIGGSTGVGTVAGFSGNSPASAWADGAGGVNMMNGLWGFMPRGGNGGSNTVPGASGLGGYGFSGSGAGQYNTCGNGGKFIFILAESIFGTGTFVATGGYPSSTTSYETGGGGGMVLIITKKWAGTNGIDVSAGNYSSSLATRGQDGSYVILKLNADNTLTLMVHSQNGVSADLNGQTPVHGADASIAW